MDVVLLVVVVVMGLDVAVASMSRILEVVVGGGFSYFGLQTTLHVQPSRWFGICFEFVDDLKTNFKVSSPENFKLAVLFPQYFLWKSTVLTPVFES